MYHQLTKNVMTNMKATIDKAMTIEKTVVK